MKPRNFDAGILSWKTGKQLKLSFLSLSYMRPRQGCYKVKKQKSKTLNNLFRMLIKACCRFKKTYFLKVWIDVIFTKIKKYKYDNTFFPWPSITNFQIPRLSGFNLENTCFPGFRYFKVQFHDFPGFQGSETTLGLLLYRYSCTSSNTAPIVSLSNP